MSMYPVVIGRFEYIDLVGECSKIPAKIDTGAQSSSIHAKKVTIKEVNGVEELHFTVLGHSGHADKVNLTTKTFSKIGVRSSNGHVSMRYKVNLRIKLGHKIFTTTFTLADRSAQVFPVLIGRDALRGRFLVNVASAGVSEKDLQKALDGASLKEDIEGMSA